ncbi:MAG TPA: HEAT repeat domain-containing protein, partial [Pirellulales bacterium]
DRATRGEQRAHGRWVVERLGGLSGEQVATLSEDPEALVRIHLTSALAEREQWDTATTEVVRKLARDGDPYVRRAAADALGRHPDLANIPILAAIWKEAPAGDALLVHTARMAMRDQLLPSGAYAGATKLIAENPSLRPLIADVSLGAPTPDAAAFLAAYVHDLLADTPLVEESMYHAARYGSEESLPALAKTAARFESATWDRQVPVLEGLKRGLADRGKPFPDELKPWALDLEKKLLTWDDEGHARRGLELTRQLKLPESYELVAALARPGAKFGGLRQLAIDVCATTSGERAIPMLCEVCGADGDDFAIRQKAAQALAGVNTEKAHEELVGLLKKAPAAIAVEIASGLAISRGGAEKLLTAVAEGKASPRLLQEQQVAARLRTSALPGFEQRVATLTAGLPAADDRVTQLLATRKNGFKSATPDATRGQAAFRRVCASCHKVEGFGQKIGPELEGVGVRGLERVLEDVLNPSRNVDQAFRTTIIETAGGRAIAGLLLREEGETLVLADNQGKEVRIPSAEVESRTASPLSPMPANIAEQLPEAEFYDLVQYLLNQQQAPAPKPAP